MTGSNHLTTSERRRAPRRRTLIGATIRFNARISSMSCRVRNMSGTGAMVEVANPAWIPDRFDLDIPHLDLRAPVRAMWRDETSIGLMFLSRAAGDEASLTDAEKITGLQQERERLKARVRQLSEEM